MLRQGQLYKDSVNGVIVVQLEDFLEQLCLGDFSRKVDQITVDTGLRFELVRSNEPRSEGELVSAYLTGSLELHADIGGWGKSVRGCEGGRSVVRAGGRALKTYKSHYGHRLYRGAEYEVSMWYLFAGVLIA